MLNSHPMTIGNWELNIGQIIFSREVKAMKRIIVSLTLVVCLLLSAAPVVAHHAFATEFDANKPVTKKGYVTKIEWTNPHVWFYLNVKNGQGVVENWGFEMGGPNGLANQGWTRNTMKLGDELVVDGFLARNGSRNVNAKTVIMAATGKKLGAASSQGQPEP
jgi:hypothetical protein